MMLPFGKPVAEPTFDAIQARWAMAHHGSSIVVLYLLSVLHPCTYAHRNHTQVGAFPPAVFHRARRAFPGADRRRLW